MYIIPFKQISVMLCWNSKALKTGFRWTGRKAKFWKSSLPPFESDWSKIVFMFL